jgi:hypothetical protein
MTADSIDAIAARLSAGAAGRTEADIQSDVRKFLLDAPLELTEPGVIDIKLEAQAGEGRRIDVEAGCAAIEVKRSLDSKLVFDKAVAQLGGYVAQRTQERGQRYVGVLTDGRTWVLFHLTPDGELDEVSRLQVAGAADAPALVAWLDHVLTTTSNVKPTHGEIVRRLGAGSPGFALDLADLTSLYDACRDDPDVRLKRELWARLLVAALGTNFEDSDELFVAHTYLVLTAELLAHAVVGIPVDDPTAGVRDLLEGTRFDLVGLHGVVEADFFDWPASTPVGIPIVRGIAAACPVRLVLRRPRCVEGALRVRDRPRHPAPPWRVLHPRLAGRSDGPAGLLGARATTWTGRVAEKRAREPLARPRPLEAPDT